MDEKLTSKSDEVIMPHPAVDIGRFFAALETAP